MSIPIRTEAFIDGAWQDISADVRQRDPVTVKAGRSNESSRTETTTATLTLNNGRSRVNPDVIGRYSPRNPRSDLFGKLGRNTLIRSGPVLGTTLILSGNPDSDATTPNDASFGITGDIDVRIRLKPIQGWRSGENETLALRWNAGADQRSWVFRLRSGFGGLSGAALFVRWTTDGTTATEQIRSTGLSQVEGGTEVRALRFTIKTDDGAGSHVTTFYTAPDVNGPWTILSEDIQAGTTSIHAGTGNLEIGSNSFLFTDNFHGNVDRFQLRDGIDGVVVADVDFTAQQAGATSFTDDTGHVWTLNGDAELGDDYLIRFTGEVAEWPLRWNLADTDLWVPIQANGILRRLARGGNKPLQSALRRINGRPVPLAGPAVAYWPLDDGEDVTEGRPVFGNHAFRTIGSPGQPTVPASHIKFGAGELAPWLEPGVQIGQDAGAGSTLRMEGRVNMSTDAADWRLEHVRRADGGGSQRSFIYIRGNGDSERFDWTVEFFPDFEAVDITLEIFDAAGQLTATHSMGLTFLRQIFDDQLHHIQLESTELGSDVRLVIWVDGQITLGLTVPNLTNQGVALVQFEYDPPPSADDNLTPLSLGHVAMWEGETGPVIRAEAAFGYVGERAGDRIQRLCVEEGILFSRVGDLADTEPLGPQQRQSLAEQLMEAARTDGGVLRETRYEFGITYLTRANLYNRLSLLELDYAAGHIGAGFEPTDDDQHLANDVTVRRIGGASVRRVQETGPLSVQPPPAGVGTYDRSLDVSVATDDQLPDQAGLRLHLGTIDDARYPSVPVILLKHQNLAQAVDVVDGGARLTVANPPEWLPPDLIDTTVHGYREEFGITDWRISFVTTPYAFTVGVLDRDRIAAASAELAAAFEAGVDTSMSVAVDPLATTDASQFPFDVRVAGVVLRVTAITGASSPQTFTVQQAPVNGVEKLIAAGATVRLDQPFRLAM